MIQEPETAETASPLALVVADMMFGARARAALEQMGWRSTVLTRPEAALAEARANRPTLLLLELGAGNAARLELLRTLRADPALADLPVLAFGSHMARAALTSARDAGATMVVSNGALVARFEQYVTKALEKHLREDERFVTDDE